MDRRNFLKSVTGVATAVAAGSATADTVSSQHTGLASPHIGSTKRHLRLALSDADNSQGIADFCQQFSARVHALTEGAIGIEVVHQSGSDGDAMARGDVECYCATAHLNQNAAPELAFFAGLPGEAAMDAVTVHNWLNVGGGQDLWDDISAGLGVKSLAIAHTGPSSGLWSRAPITDLSAISGQTLFAEGLAVDVVKGIGAEAFGGTSQDVAKALSNETLFAAEVGDIPTALATGLVQTVKIVYAPGINRVGSVVSFCVQKTIWDDLRASERALIETAAATTYHDTVAFTQSQSRMMRAACTTQFGVRFEEVAPAVAQTVARVSDIAIAHLAAASPRAARINASYMTFLKANALTS